jgi:3-hydroxyisobutyrate dehydrogenase-like beta-hydroxyacid dehydrogenase
MRVAFLGLGAMGMPMAANIAKAGHTLVVWNRTPKKFVSSEGPMPSVAETLAEAVENAEVVVTMLANDAAVEDIVEHQGLLNALRPDAVHVSMSMVGIGTARRLTERHKAARRAYVAAPVLGRPDVAQAQKLWVLAAGEARARDYVRPTLQAIGRGITDVSDIPWHANLVKLADNMMLASMLETFGEAYALMRKADVDPAKFQESVNSLFQSPVYANYGAITAERSHQPALFKAPLGLKDLRLVLAAAEELEVPLPAVGLAHDNLLAAIAGGDGDKDWSVLAREAQRRAGLN